MEKLEGSDEDLNNQWSDLTTLTTNSGLSFTGNTVGRKVEVNW